MCGGGDVQEWDTVVKDVKGRIRETLRNKLTVREKRKLVTDDIKCSEIGDKPKGNLCLAHLSNWVKARNSRTCKSLILFVSGLRFGKKSEYKQMVCFRLCSTASLTHHLNPALIANASLALKRSLFQLALFTSPLRVGLHVLRACLSDCAVLKHVLFHLIAVVILFSCNSCWRHVLILSRSEAIK